MTAGISALAFKHAECMQDEFVLHKTRMLPERLSEHVLNMA